MELITGPVGSGKTSLVLDRLRASLRAGEYGHLVLAPTTTLAEHLRNQLAREGLVFRPSAISTFAKFTGSFVPDSTVLSGAALEILIQDLLQTSDFPSFAKVREFSGFRRALAGAISEASTAGLSAAALGSFNLDTAVLRDFSRLFLRVEQEAFRRGQVLPAERFRIAAERIAERGLPGISSVSFSGFFSFTPSEIGLVQKVARHTRCVVTLPAWSGAEQAIASLKAIGFEEHTLEQPTARPRRTIVAPPTLDLEVTEIARRILLERAAGRPYRDMGIIVRSEEPYAAALRGALARFGIPSRFYFGSPLRTHPVVAYLYGLLEAMLDGWDHEQTLAVLRREGSPLALADAFDFAVKAELPGRGLEGLARHAPAEYAGLFQQLAALEALRDKRMRPSQWAKRLEALTGLFHPQSPRDLVSHERAMLWREQSAALDTFQSAIQETAAVLDEASAVSCSEFAETLTIVLESGTLRVGDHRRDVVHVMDAFEARQWKLPVVFLCGMLERQFPKYHSENPILPDTFRRQIRSRGFALATSLERQRDEEFLFHVACARATEALVLSYPMRNSKGEPNLPSFFVSTIRSGPGEPVSSTAARPVPTRSYQRAPRPSIHDEDLQLVLRKQTARLGPTRIEDFLQCPYKFFAVKILKLQEAPARPWDRLNLPLQGRIAHEALRSYYRDGGQVAQIFTTIFQEACKKENVPDGYRTEAVRLELLYHLETFVRNSKLQRGDRMLLEHEFAWRLDADTIIHGYIDRIDVDPGGRATIVDYKYRSEARIRQTVKAHDEGTLVQGGLYLIALAQGGEFVPAGMIYCGFKKKETLDGWRPGETNEDALREVMRHSREITQNALVQIREGRIEPKPSDLEKCGYCAYAVICRVGERAEIAAGAGAPR
ncbi:MAG TPA: PD-(D/E)XK nuclease family protein [Bryobacteraceae bacterium]|nr:PD-(D/E)XK nuclease family protein [Bryobacteraceae bacterium]